MKKNKKKKSITFFTNIKKTYRYAKQGRKYLFVFLLMNIMLIVNCGYQKTKS